MIDKGGETSNPQNLGGERREVINGKVTGMIKITS